MAGEGRGQAWGRRLAPAQRRASAGASLAPLCLYGGIKRVLSLHLAESALSRGRPFFGGRISGAIRRDRADQVQHNRLEASPFRSLAPSPAPPLPPPWRPCSSIHQSSQSNAAFNASVIYNSGRHRDSLSLIRAPTKAHIINSTSL